MSQLDISRFQAACAQAVAARDFHAPHSVTFFLNPSIPGHREQIDEISLWALSKDRVGRNRRTANAAKGEVTFEFELPVDAVECSLRFL